MAEKACHTFAFTTQVGLTQALGMMTNTFGGSMKIAIPACCLVFLGGCVSASPVLPTGDNAYMISVVSHAQWKEAIERGIIEANTFCAKQNKKATVTNSTTAGTDMMSSSKAQVWFTCN